MLVSHSRRGRIRGGGGLTVAPGLPGRPGDPPRPGGPGFPWYPAGPTPPFRPGGPGTPAPLAVTYSRAAAPPRRRARYARDAARGEAAHRRLRWLPPRPPRPAGPCVPARPSQSSLSEARGSDAGPDAKRGCGEGAGAQEQGGHASSERGERERGERERAAQHLEPCGPVWPRGPSGPLGPCGAMASGIAFCSSECGRAMASGIVLKPVEGFRLHTECSRAMASGIVPALVRRRKAVRAVPRTHLDAHAPRIALVALHPLAPDHAGGPHGSNQARRAAGACFAVAALRAMGGALTRTDERGCGPCAGR